MSKKNKIDIEVEKIEQEEKAILAKKRKSANQRRQFTLKVAGWVMAIVMVLGTLLSIFSMLIYYNK